MSYIKQKLIKLERIESVLKSVNERQLDQYKILRKLQINQAEIDKSIGIAAVESEILEDNTFLWEQYSKNSKCLKIELDQISKNL